MRTLLLTFAVVIIGLWQTPGWSAIRAQTPASASGSLTLVGRIQEMARMDLTADSAPIDLGMRAAVSNEPVGEFGFLSNTEMLPISAETIPSPDHKKVFERIPYIFAHDCTRGATPSNGVNHAKKCTLRGTWRVLKNAKPGTHPVWVRVTLSAV